MANRLASFWSRVQPLYAGVALSGALTGAQLPLRKFPDERFNAIVGALIGLVLVLGWSLRAVTRRIGRQRAAALPALRLEPGLGRAPARVAPPSAAPARLPDTTSWSRELLNALAPQRFAALCAACFRSMGFGVGEPRPLRGTHAIDLALHGDGAASRSILARCLAARREPVDSDAVLALRELLRAGVAAQGIMVTSGEFTRAARELADGATLRLVDGHDILWKLTHLDAAQRDALLALATEGDFAAAPAEPAARHAAPLEPEHWGRLLP